MLPITSVISITENSKIPKHNSDPLTYKFVQENSTEKAINHFYVVRMAISLINW